MRQNSFLLGAATAAHQVEGNNVHSDCWTAEHIKHSSYTEPSGAAVDHYNRYAEDIRFMANAGLNAYRFSIEWARIEPEEGRFDGNEIEHYRRVLTCCLDNGLTPVVTLHHFSSPAWLIGKGGWGGNYVVGAFTRYCEYVVRELGALMPLICTINEANMGFQLKKVAQDMMNSSRREGGVQVGVKFDIRNIISGMFEQGKAFRCSPFAVNGFLNPRSRKQEIVVMQAHQSARQAIKAINPEIQVGLTLSLFDYQPADGGEARAAELWYDDFGFYLPYIQDDDFLGVQNYTRKIVGSEGARQPADGAPLTQMGYENYPVSIGHVVEKIAKEFPGDLYVTENGIATSDDEQRCTFIRSAVDGVLKAKADGARVQGYFYWSLLDNFEWQAGYSKTFGLIAVDRTTMERIPKPSLAVLGETMRGGVYEN